MFMYMYIFAYLATFAGREKEANKFSIPMFMKVGIYITTNMHPSAVNYRSRSAKGNKTWSRFLSLFSK